MNAPRTPELTTVTVDVPLATGDVLRHVIEIGKDWLDLDPEAAWKWIWEQHFSWMGKAREWIKEEAA